MGVAQSSHLVEIRARVEGYLDKIAYVEGGSVTLGQLMFQLDQKPFQTALESAMSELSKQEAVLWNATRAKERLDPLFQKNAAVEKISMTLFQENSRLKRMCQVQNLVLSKQNSIWDTRQSPLHQRIGRPFEISRRGFDHTGQNGLLTTVSVIDPIWVNFSVSEGDILRSTSAIEKKQLLPPENMSFGVHIILADGSTLPDVGKVDFADPSLNQETGL